MMKKKPIKYRVVIFCEMAADVLGVGHFPSECKTTPPAHPRPSTWSTITLFAIIHYLLHLRCPLTGIPGSEETDAEVHSPVIWKLS